MANYGDTTVGGDGKTYILAQGPQGPYWQPMAQTGLIAPAGAMTQPTNIADLRNQAGDDGIFQRPFFPTAPRYYRGSGKITRVYSVGLLPTDDNYAIGSEVVIPQRFDIPCTAVAFNGWSFVDSEGNAFPVGVHPNGCWLFRAEYVTGEKLHITQRLAIAAVGTGERPGEIGGDGWEIDQGGALLIGITPLMANLRIDVTIVCLEQRGKRNFHAQKSG